MKLHFGFELPKQLWIVFSFGLVHIFFEELLFKLSKVAFQLCLLGIAILIQKYQC